MSHKRVRSINLLLALMLAMTSILALVGVSYAGDFRGGDQVIIGEDEVINDDLCVGASRLVVDGTIKGDLYAVAQEIVINGTVEGNVLCGAQFITVNGTVADNVFAGGMSLSLGPAASVGHNVLFGGFGLEAEPGSRIGHDVLMGGYQAQLSGEIAQDLRAGLGALELNGKVGRDVEVEVGAAEEGPSPTAFFPAMPIEMLPLGLRIADSASIGGELTYTSESEGQIASGAQIRGGVAHQTPPPEDRGRRDTVNVLGMGIVAWVARVIGTFIALLIVGALVLWLLPEAIHRVTDVLQAQPWPSLGWGCLTEIVVFVGVPLAVAVVIVVALISGAVTLGQLAGTVMSLGLTAVSLLTASFSLVAVYVTKVVVAFLVGRLILKQVQPSWAERWFWPLLLGVILFVILRAIPFVGALISFAVTLIGLGAIVLGLRDYWRQRRLPAVAVS
jgi:cytoskeletal protein CcmA (bactofilin family)